MVADTSPGYLSGLSGFLDFSPDFVAIVNAEGRYLQASRALKGIHGYAPSELLGRSILEFVHPDERSDVEKAIEAGRAEAGTALVLRFRFRDKEAKLEPEPADGLSIDSAYRWVEASFGPVSDGDAAGSLIVISRDVTAVAARESKAEESLREMDGAIREIQHRVKNSIAMISSFVSLEEGRTGPGGLRDALESLRFRVDSISTLYRIQFASGDSDAIDLRSYLEKVITDIAQTIDRPDVAMEMELAETALDTKRAVPLGILCTELVANALRHGFGESDRGAVEVSLRVVSDRLVLIVEDDGQGLPEGFRLSAQDGLGLQIAKMLAQQLKGRLDFGTRLDGRRGAHFALDMPYRVMD